MQKIVLSFIFIVLTGAASYLGSDWVRKQSFILYCREYIAAVDELDQMWRSQQTYPNARVWFGDFYFQRRSEVLERWAKQLVDYDRQLHLQTEIAKVLKKSMASKPDFRNSEQYKFHILELKSLEKRLPSAQLKKTNFLVKLVASNFVFLKALVEENQLLVKRNLARVQQLEALLVPRQPSQVMTPVPSPGPPAQPSPTLQAPSSASSLMPTTLDLKGPATRSSVPSR